MSALLLFFSTWRWWLIGGTAAALLLVIGHDRITIAELETSVAKWQGAEAKARADHSKAVASAALAAKTQAEDFRQREQTLTRHHQETIDDAEKRFAAQHAADAASAAAATGRLSSRVAALTAAARRAAEGPASAGSCAPAAEAADLLADMQRRIDEAAGRIGDHADDAYARGQLCERLSDQTEQTLNATTR